MHEHINSGHKEKYKIHKQSSRICNLAMTFTMNVWWYTLIAYGTFCMTLLWCYWHTSFGYLIGFIKYSTHKHSLRICTLVMNINSPQHSAAYAMAYQVWFQKVQKFNRNGTHKQRRSQGLPHYLRHIETATNAAVLSPPPPPHRTSRKD